MEQVDAARVLPALYLPTPRVELGLALRGVASAAIDISDGLLADLGHILERSGVGAAPIGARLEFAALPTLPIVQSYLHEAVARQCVVAGGDDYELCFTASADKHDAVVAAGERAGVAVTRVGTITGEPGLAVVAADGTPLTFEHAGYDHFAA
jgi:thiamine-monophosphate kinase